MLLSTIEAEHMKSNPARDVRRKKCATNGFYTWTLSDLTAFENRHPIGSKARLALSLLLYLGVRRGDLVRLGKQHIHAQITAPGRQGRVIKFTPNKTRYRRITESEKPILPVLEQIIEASPYGDETFLQTELGKPFTAKGFGKWFRDRCDEAGLPKCSAHGVRKIGATLCVEKGNRAPTDGDFRLEHAAAGGNLYARGQSANLGSQLHAHARAIVRRGALTTRIVAPFCRTSRRGKIRPQHQHVEKRVVGEVGLEPTKA
jgi:integrase